MYDQELGEWQANQTGRIKGAEAFVSNVATAQGSARRAFDAVEREYNRRMNTRTLDGLVEEGYTSIGARLEVDGDRILESRFYIATFVTDWGEESAPSAVSDMVEVDQYSAVEVEVPAPPPGRHITKWRLYRSNTGSEMSAFQFVAEGEIASRTYVDSKRGADLGEVSPTSGWLEPPFRQDSAGAPKGAAPYLRGAVGMPNGIVAGFIDNFVAFCEPYHPYAWPVEYQITTEHPIVGLGVFGQSLFVGTMGAPYIMSGADSANMSALQLQSDQSCVARRSICGVGNGAIYASPDGLCLATPSGVQLLTAELWAREDWQALHPHEIIAVVHEGVYYFWTSQGGYALDFVSKRLGRVSVDPTAVHQDVLTDHVYGVVGARVVQLFAGSEPREALWRSGPAQLPAPAPFAWLQVDGDQSDMHPVVVQWFGDGQLRHTATLRDLKPQRLPPGRYLEHEFEVRTRARVTKVLMAGNTAELKQS